MTSLGSWSKVLLGFVLTSLKYPYTYLEFGIILYLCSHHTTQILWPTSDSDTIEDLLFTYTVHRSTWPVKKQALAPSTIRLPSNGLKGPIRCISPLHCLVSVCRGQVRSVQCAHGISLTRASRRIHWFRHRRQERND
jgi:hypothetical protein